MPFIFIVFVISLVGISFMIWRKLLLLDEGTLVVEDNDVFHRAYLEEWKNDFISNSKKYGYILLVELIRLYVKTISGAKALYAKIVSKAKEMYLKRAAKEGKEIEANKFLKKVSEYKKRIKRIREKVSEEENLE